MTKSELIESIAAKQAQLSAKDVELAVKTILEHMSQSLAALFLQLVAQALTEEIKTDSLTV